MSTYIKFSEISACIKSDLEHHQLERDKAELNGYDGKRVDAAVIEMMCDRHAQGLLDNAKKYEFDDRDEMKETLYWEEMSGDDKGLHRCPVCKEPAFNYNDGDEIVEDLSEYCHRCGQRLYIK